MQEGPSSSPKTTYASGGFTSAAAHSEAEIERSVPRVLFVPVSGDMGAGEYYRCLAVAKALNSSIAPWAISFVVNREAQVERPGFIDYRFIDGAAKRNLGLVAAHVLAVRPDVVVLDSTVNPQLLRAVGATGAYIIYVSWRPRTRKLGFYPRNLRRIDEHWMVCSPEHHSLRFRERLSLLTVRKRPDLVFLTALTAPPDDLGKRQVLAGGTDVPEEGFVLFCAGGGGTEVGGVQSSQLFQLAARRLHAEIGVPVVFVAGPQSNVAVKSVPGRLEVSAVASEILSALMKDARVVVCGGGSMLQQGVVLGAACIAADAGGSDQRARIDDYGKKGLIVPIDLDPRNMAEAAAALMNDSARRKRMRDIARKNGFSLDMQRVCDRLGQLRLKSARD